MFVPVARMSPASAKDALRKCLGVSGRIQPSRHFLGELKNETLTLVEAWQVLRTGTIFSAPEHDVATGEWKYGIEGKEPEGRSMAIVFCFKQIDYALLITIFSIERAAR
jgi:hypothetical protein